MSGATDPRAGQPAAGGADEVRGAATDAQAHGPQGGTVTDMRGAAQAGPYDGPGAQQGYGAAGAPPGAPPPSATPLPNERMPQQQSAQPYHPPQAYQTGAGAGVGAGAGAMRRPRTGASTTPRTRKARLRVAKADPWSVMKVSFLLSIALGICTIVAVAVLWMVLDTIGVFSTVGSTISEATTSEQGGKGGFDLVSFLSLNRVMLFTTVIAVIDVVLATALATLGAFIYNLSAGFVGGIELTLAEDE